MRIKEVIFFFIYFFNHQFPELASKLSSYKITDAETVTTIKEVYEKENYLLDPHGAVGYLALKMFLNNNPGLKGIFLETAHPIKFPDAVESATQKKMEIPEAMLPMMNAVKKSVKIRPSYDLLKEYLLQTSAVD